MTTEATKPGWKEEIYVPLEADWERGKTLASCKCDAADCRECENFECEDIEIGANKDLACTCPCHSTPAAEEAVE
jgi:hypothetical protein